MWYIICFLSFTFGVVAGLMLDQWLENRPFEDDL